MTPTPRKGDTELGTFWKQAYYVGERNSYAVVVRGEIIRDKDTLRLFEKWLEAKARALSEAK